VIGTVAVAVVADADAGVVSLFFIGFC